MTLATDRRTAFKIGVAGLAALAAPQIMTRAAHAEVPKPDVKNAGYNVFNLGKFQVVAINDGLVPGSAPHDTFGIGQKPEDVTKLLEDNFLPADRTVTSFTPVVVNTGQDLVLFDTGLGEGGRAGTGGLLRERLQSVGYKPEDITVVALTHFHGDHISGLMEDGQPAFPNARYVAGRQEHDFWTSEAAKSGPTENGARAVQNLVVPLAEKTTFIEEGGEVVPGITGMLAVGHTPGHMIFNVESEGERLVLTGDTCNHHVASLQRPDWHVRFDMDKEKGAEARRRVFDMIAADRVPFIGYHMPFPAMGYVEKLDLGYRFVPVTYQFL
jgi:glyoxylase-like metal-dependent hydrolase (beta-lactamase superfamily II)